MPVPLPMHGRGASWNPPNRFETLHVEPEPDDWVDPDDPEPAPATQLFRDVTKEILSENDSPDLSFTHGINAYRGCSHGCVYCVGPNTPVLHSDLVWRPIGEIHEGDEVVSFDEFPALGHRYGRANAPAAPTGTRKLRKATVEAVWWSRKPTLRLITEHAEVITTAEHRWLQATGFRWSRTERLAPRGSLRHLHVEPREPEDHEYRMGYIAGVSLGGGTCRNEPGGRSDQLGLPPARRRVAMADVGPLRRLVRFGRQEGVELGRPEWPHGVFARELDSRSYRRGFLAGFFDAEGHDGTSLRISRLDAAVLERVARYARSFGFTTRLEMRTGAARGLRLVGSIADRIRFLSLVQPAVRRRVDRVFGHLPPTEPERILAIEKGPSLDVVDIQTSTATFYAAGLASHNCFARPYHEYLGFSAGLDFETKIVVKENAPALLRKRLASPRWQPQTLMMSGATDPYQPIERKLRITRGIVEVLAEFRSPVAIITKNHLVTRDLDLLTRLAEHGAVACVLSITTLRNELQRVLEPRTSVPARRLDAVRRLAAAGVPVGVNVAPVIPGLTDQEMPAILEAAAEAGAQFANFVTLRLPYAVKDLFATWLEQHFPDRKEKVLNRLRDLHDGKLYDSTWGQRGRGGGAYAEQIEQVFRVAAKKVGLNRTGERPGLSSAAFRVPGSVEQLGLL